MTYLFFEELREMLEREVCPRINLKRPVQGDDVAFTLTPPVISIGWPEEEITSPVLRDRIPGIAIGLDGSASDDGEVRLIPVQLACIVYSPGTHTGPGELDISRRNGYQDLVNLVDLTVRAIRRGDPVTPHLTLAKPEIEWWADGDSYGDYWLGGVSCTLKAAPIPGRGETDLL